MSHRSQIPSGQVSGYPKYAGPLGFTVSPGSARTLWNANMRATDRSNEIFASRSVISTLTVGLYTIAVSYVGVSPPTDLATSLTDGAPGGLAAAGQNYQTFGDEAGTVYANMISHLNTAVSAIHTASQLCLYVPTYNGFATNLPTHPDLVSTPDACLLQTQSQQDSATYITDVQTVVQQMRGAGGTHPLGVQIQCYSQNTGDPYTATQVINWIDQAAVAWAPDWINVYYGAFFSVLQSVIANYRP